MNCQQTSQVHAYVDQRLAAQARAEFEEHLALCAECRELLNDLTVLRTMLQQAELPEIEAGTLARLDRSFFAARDREIRRMAGWLTAAAAVLLISTLAMWPDRGGEAPTSLISWDSVERVAVTPPGEAIEESVPSQVELAQWVAEDLAGARRRNVP